MKSVEYINGHMKGKVFLANEEDTETYAIYYHTGCGKQDRIRYDIVEDIAIANVLDYLDMVCDNCIRINNFNVSKQKQYEDHECNCIYCGYWYYHS